MTSVSGNRQWRDYAIAQSRITEADAGAVEQRLRVAETMAHLINNVHLHNVSNSFECMECCWQVKVPLLLNYG